MEQLGCLFGAIKMLRNSLFGAVKLNKFIDTEKYKYSGYVIGFDARGYLSLSSVNGFGNY